MHLNHYKLYNTDRKYFKPETFPNIFDALNLNFILSCLSFKLKFITYISTGCVHFILPNFTSKNNAYVFY